MKNYQQIAPFFNLCFFILLAPKLSSLERKALFILAKLICIANRQNQQYLPKNHKQ